MNPGITACAEESGSAIDIGAILDNLPLSQRVHKSQHEGRQALTSIADNLEAIYDTGCVIEMPYVGKNRPEHFPSRELDFVPLEVLPDTTLDVFLDKSCSEGQIQWNRIHNAVHVWPTALRPGKEEYLDTVKVSLDLEGLSVLEAVKAWALEVNRNRDFSGHGVKAAHTSNNANRVKKETPPSLLRAGAVTLSMTDVTAREALCAIQGASREWATFVYFHKTNGPDSLRLHARLKEALACREVTPEERAALDAQEDLKSLLVESAMAGEQR
jgi:hypothetical protein